MLTVGGSSSLVANDPAATVLQLINCCSRKNQKFKNNNFTLEMGLLGPLGVQNRSNHTQLYGIISTRARSERYPAIFDLHVV